MKFTKSHRLLTDIEFTQVFSAAHGAVDRRRTILNAGPYTIYIRPISTEARLGLSIGRKTVRRAHNRNRIKRCVREFFRTNLCHLQGDIIVKVQREPTIMSYESLTEPLKMLTRK